MIKQRRTRVEVDLQQIQTMEEAQAFVSEKIKPWLAEFDKDGLRYSNLRFFMADSMLGNPYITEVIVEVDTQVEDSDETK